MTGSALFGATACNTLERFIEGIIQTTLADLAVTVRDGEPMEVRVGKRAPPPRWWVTRFPLRSMAGHPTQEFTERELHFLEAWVRDVCAESLHK